MVQLMPLLPHHLLPHKNPDWFSLCCRLTPVVLEKRLLNRCLSVNNILMFAAASYGPWDYKNKPDLFHCTRQPNVALVCVYIIVSFGLFMHVAFVVLVHGQVTIIFVVSVGLSVCLFVCAEFSSFSAVFDPISIKLGHVICLGLVVSPRI